MATKKGLSDAEKRTRMSEIFLSDDFYTYKEIEKIAIQEKKIVSQSVKEVLQSLVDDGLVSSDKIGTSIYYWSFPSDAKRTREAKIEELNNELQTLQQRQLELKNAIEGQSSDVQDSDEREMLLRSLDQKEAQKKAKERGLRVWKAADPRAVEEKLGILRLYREAVSQVTNNIFLFHHHFTHDLGFGREDVNAQFDINEEELNDAT